MSDTSSLNELITALSRAELSQDTDLLDTLLAKDFYGVGPVGFVLDRAQWIARFSGGLVITSHELKDFSFREYGDFAIGIGVQAQELTYNGRPNNGNFRITIAFIKEEGTWKALSMHLSQMMAPPA
jgi:hypothetical protein